MQGSASASAQVLFQQSNQAQKKKKVRPEEKKKLETEKEDEDSGFEIMKKMKAPVKARGGDDQNKEIEGKEKRSKNKGAYNPRYNKVPKGKREFERQSGTGRGREISKNGAGGKHTWGTNPKNVAREDEYNYDEQVFNNALNPKKQKEEVAAEEKVSVEAKVEETAEVKVEETAEVAVEESAKVEEQAEGRRKKRGVEQNTEVAKEDLVDRPENAISLNEYMAQLKVKNQAISSKPSQAVKVENDLQARAKAEDTTIGIEGRMKKAKGKKEKKQNTNVELNVEFRSDDAQYERQDRNQNKKKNANKFQFSKEEFPEL